MAMQNLYLVRPNLGNPLILRPKRLNYFVVWFAYQKPHDWKEKNVPYPSTREILNQLRRDPPKISWKDKEVTLNIQDVHQFFRHPHFEADYGDVKHARSNREQQYYNGFRWEIRAGVGIDDNKIEELKNSIGWPTLLNLRYGSTNSHAIYVHENLDNSNEFTILHITDTHIAQRNDKIPELLSQVRNKSECEFLAAKYVNFNDNLRAFIKTANERWRAETGKVIVVLTGDIVDHYFDGWWNGKFICGQGSFAEDRRKEATGSSWGYSNVSKFREIILGTDKKGEELLCPIFTVLGNHDYLMNEVLMKMQFYFDILIKKWTYDKNSYQSFGLTQDEGREYDYWAFPRNGGKHRSIAKRKTFKENIEKDDWKATLDQDWSYWLAKPKSWQLSQYLRQISYDIDHNLTLGNCRLIFVNTGEDRYPRQEEFAGWESKEDSDRDYISGGPHNRGIHTGHTGSIRNALRDAPEYGLIFVFTHAPLMSLEKDKAKGMEVLFENNHEKSPPPPNAVSDWLSDLYGKTHRALIKKGFPLTNTKYFKRGKRAPFLNFSSADGDAVQFLDLINRLSGKETDTPIFVFSGHTHKVHEFRIEKIRDKRGVDDTNFHYFLDNYSSRYFKFTTHGMLLWLRYHWYKKHSPFLFTSGALKTKNPQYREIIVKGQIASLEMKEITDIEKMTVYIPGCRHIALRAHNGQYVSAERARAKGGELAANRKRIGDWETFEIIELEGNKVAFMAYNGQFVRAEGGGGGMLKPDKAWIKGHETFELIKRDDNKIALRTKNGQYVCAEGGGGRELIANRKHIKEWETFELIELEKLETPKQISPTHGTVFSHYPRRTTLRWEPVIGAKSYTVEYGYKSGNKWISSSPRTSNTTSYIFGFIGAQPGRWRVWAVSAHGVESAKSSWWEFRYTK